MNRDEFFARIHDAAAAGRAYRVRRGEAAGERVGYEGGGDDPAATLAAEVDSLGGHAYLVHDLPAAQAALGSLLDQFSPRTALCWQHPLLTRLGLNEYLSGRGVRVLDYDRLVSKPHGQRRNDMLAADIGISSVSFAIAASGTLAMVCEPGRERSVSLLPPVHVALLEANQILPDLFDLFDRLTAEDPSRMPTNLTLITGPSKTGDLELRLTTGVHGPGQWHVIIVR